jgi:hypothetical protein
MTFLPDCQSDSKNNQYPYETSFSKAEKHIGVEIPEPDYLPEGYEMDKILLRSKNIVSLFYISSRDEELELKIMCERIIPWKVDEEAPTVKIGDNLAQLLEYEDNNRIVWNWFPDTQVTSLYVISLYYPKDLPFTEIVKIADSLKL